MTLPPGLTIPVTALQLNERGNIWLASEDDSGHSAWLRLDSEKHLWLEICIRPMNYPGLNVNVITATDEELAKHIRTTFADGFWYVRKCCLEAVLVDDQHHVVGYDPVESCETALPGP